MCECHSNECPECNRARRNWQEEACAPMLFGIHVIAWITLVDCESDR